MAESNPTQVILTDDGLKIIKAQDTANEAVGNINDINSDNKLTPSEKLKLKQEYDKDSKIYAIDVSQLQSAGLPTTELETAMSNLTNFVTPLFEEMYITSTVDRDTLNSIFTAFATADKNASQAFVNKVQQVADDAKKAGDDAKQAGEEAQEVGQEAKASAEQAKTDATQAKADALTAQQKAQSSIDQFNAHLPDIDKALSTANLVKQDVTKLSDTTEQYHNEYTTGIKNVIKTIDDTSTEIDQLTNAIKLKADSTDVTSQINVAIQGIQTDVTNKVTDLNTKISQTSDAVQILATTGGQKNLVYNSSYTNNAEGWNTFNSTGYLSTLAVSSYNGSPGFGVSVSGKGTSAWTEFGESKRYTLPQPDTVAAENTYSASAMIKIYSDSDSASQLGATLAYYDKNGARIGFKDMLVSYDSKDVWTEVKFENLPVPKGAYSIGLQYQAHGSKVHGMIAQPMIVFGPKIGPYQPDVVGQSDITASINNIHLGVKGADGSTSTFNMNNNTILLDANKIVINGNTSIQNGTIGTAKIANAAINTAQIADGAINNAKIANASIDDAKINSLNGNKIIARSITSEQLNADDIIANVINGKTINGITMNTPKLNLGTNGILTEDWMLDQNTGWFQPKKGTGSTTLDMGVLRMSGNLSRWWNGDGSDQYWYGIADNGAKITNGSNPVTDDYAPGYEKHDIVGSNGVLLRSYLDATGLYLNQNDTKTIMVALTQKGLDTWGYIHAQQNSVVEKWFDAGVDRGTGIRIGYRAIQVHGANDIYFNTDSKTSAVTLHAKQFSSSSQLSRKKDISPLEEEQAMETIMNTDIYRYHYKEDAESEPYNYSVIIDDIHGKPQYKTPEEFIIADRTGRNDGNATGFLIQALKNANRRISALEEIINERK